MSPACRGSLSVGAGFARFALSLCCLLNVESSPSSFSAYPNRHTSLMSAIFTLFSNGTLYMGIDYGIWSWRRKEGRQRTQWQRWWDWKNHMLALKCLYMAFHLLQGISLLCVWVISQDASTSDKDRQQSLKERMECVPYPLLPTHSQDSSRCKVTLSRSWFCWLILFGYTDKP